MGVKKQSRRERAAVLQENGGYHFSLHMYRRLQEEYSRRGQRLRARQMWEVRGENKRQRRRRQTLSQRLETEEEDEPEDSPRREQENKEECMKRKRKRGR